MRRLFIAAVLVSAGAPASAKLPESQAIEIVSEAVRQVNPGAPPKRCLAYQIEDRSHRAFDIAVRERHGGSCLGDPGVMPVIERFRVTRSPVKLWHFDIVNDMYRACRLTRDLQPTCPRQRYD